MSGAARLALAAIALLAGCQVSFFGNDPITVVGSDVGPGGSSGRACSEPEDARLARTREDGCTERCRIENGTLTGECRIARVGELRENVATIDLADADGIAITLETCDPSGIVFQLSDSETGAVDGGDAGTTSHDADILLDGTTVKLRASVGSGVAPSQIASWTPSSGCALRTIVLADQLVYFVEADAGLCGTGALRVDPPTDDEGRPDARWYLALGGTVDGLAPRGTGLGAVELCAW
jgi:hypothetical protein